MRKLIAASIAGGVVALSIFVGTLAASADDDGLPPEPGGEVENLAPNEPPPPASVYDGPHSIS